MGLTKKTAFTQRADESWDIHPKVLEEMYRLEEGVAGEFIPMTVAEANFKDEAYPVEKIAQMKARFFYVNDLATNLLLRKYLLPILAVLMEFPLETGVYVAANAASYQWGLSVQNLAKVNAQLDRILAGDQKALDQKQSKLLSYYAIAVYKIALKCGYSEKDARIARRCILMGGRGVLIVLGNFFVFDKLLTSGRSETIHGNCITCKILVYMAVGRNLLKIPLWVQTDKVHVQHRKSERTNVRFFDLIRCMFTGDDHELSVSEGLSLIGVDLQDEGTESGYIITRADKSDGPVVFQTIMETNYLQRGFEKRDGMWFGPISENSIMKSLRYVCNVSPEDEDARNRNACLCAAREWFLHGREKFDEKVPVLEGLFPDVKFPTFDELEMEYRHGIFQTWIV
jgi:hypothetical protein